MKIFRRLYNWMLSWSESRWSLVALFLFALFEASWFPLPPDILLIALCLGATKKSFRFAAICLAGSVAGAMLGYGIGFFLWQTAAGEYTSVAHFFFDHVFSEQSFRNIGDMYDKYNFWIVYTAGFTPLPFKLFTISAGVFNIDVHDSLGRCARYAFLPYRRADMEIRRTDQDLHRQVFQSAGIALYGTAGRIYSARFLYHRRQRQRVGGPACPEPDRRSCR